MQKKDLTGIEIARIRELKHLEVWPDGKSRILDDDLKWLTSKLLYLNAELKKLQKDAEDKEFQ